MKIPYLNVQVYSTSTAVVVVAVQQKYGRRDEHNNNTSYVFVFFQHKASAAIFFCFIFVLRDWRGLSFGHSGVDESCGGGTRSRELVRAFHLKGFQRMC